MLRQAGERLRKLPAPEPTRRYARVPLSVIADRRLTHRELRVLMALIACWSKKSDTVFPRRQTLSEMTGIAVSHISAATGCLVKLGYIEKTGRGGYSKATRYRLLTPALVRASLPQLGGRGAGRQQSPNWWSRALTDSGTGSWHHRRDTR